MNTSLRRAEGKVIDGKTEVILRNIHRLIELSRGTIMPERTVFPDGIMIIKFAKGFLAIE
jgi:hypothetical protein